MSYIVRDITLVSAVFYMGTQIQYVPSFPLRCALYAFYSVLQGFVFVGIWILAHECGHQAMFDNGAVNDTFGLILHSFLGVPYFSWVCVFLMVFDEFVWSVHNFSDYP